jgi:arsenite methyltransferase
MLATAGRRRAGEHAAPVSFGTGDALALPFPDGSFDTVTATQVYEYVADIPAALAEARRVLRPGGRLLILDTDWDSLVWHSSDPARMHRVLTAWDEHLADPHLPRRPAPAAPARQAARRRRLHRDTAARAPDAQCASYDANTFSAGVIGLIADFVPGRAAVIGAQAQAWRADLVGIGADYFFSLNRYLFLVVK